ncbi:MAG TPA: carboxypeptidase-like regulatory domain-containing protein, partial [Gemmatimonadaceae bacterium]|nr:carboxypeptidase-like regulatory domain-containing protein [Gemmatimonadaceae bacterium]
RAVDVRAGEMTRADLAIPSGATINRLVCGDDGRADSTGLVVGMLRDAKTGTALTTGTVQATWQELVLAKGAFSSEDQYTSAVLSSSGWFALCHVPAAVDVLTRAFRGVDSTGYLTVNVPLSGVLRRDFVIGGTADIRGVVTSDKGAVAGARVGVAGTERMTRTDSAGAFRLGGIPAGSQTIEFRALGFSPETREVELAPERDSVLDVRLTSVKQVLDTIHVVATRIFDADVNGFARRKRQGFGRFIDEEQIARRSPFDVYSILYGTPSLQIVHQGFDKSVLMRGPVGWCRPTVWMNGVRMPEDMLGELDLLVRPEELGGIEIYNHGTVPAEFYNFNNCGAIVMWTRPPLAKPKG